MSFDAIPTSVKRPVQPYTVNIPDSTLTELKSLLESARLAPETFESTHGNEGRRFGLTREWMVQAKERWTTYDWRASEKHINSFPNYMVEVEGQRVHFAALWSKKKDAIPLLLLHGWPGSFLEFLPILSLLKNKYTPETLPYNVIVPSLPGFGFSAPPPVDREFGTRDIARVFDGLMQGLGFDGYAVQGGDLGSKISRVLGAEFASCKVVHHNFCVIPKPEDLDVSTLTADEKSMIERSDKFMATGRAYAQEQATRPSTLGFVLSSSPLALLAWVGEKFLEWSDKDPEIDTVLESVSLYWLTNTISTSFYCYRDTTPWDLKINKPYGFSSFPKEIYQSPEGWLAKSGNLVFYRRHDKGGHFAALEEPEVLLGDVEDFLAQVWEQ